MGEEGAGGVLCISTHSKPQRSDEKRPFVNDGFHKIHHAAWQKDTSASKTKQTLFLMSHHACLPNWQYW